MTCVVPRFAHAMASRLIELLPPVRGIDVWQDQDDGWLQGPSGSRWAPSCRQWIARTASVVTVELLDGLQSPLAPLSSWLTRPHPGRARPPVMQSPEPHTTLLLERWQAGDPSALARLLEEHLDYIHAKVRLRMSPLLRARMQSMDCVQETLLAFLENEQRYVVANGRSFRGLMAAIATNLMLEEERWWQAKRRSITREQPMPEGSALDLTSPVRTPASLAGENEALHWNLAALDLMPSEARRILVLHLYDGLDYQEIADSLAKTYDAVRMQYKRAVKKMAEIVRQLQKGLLDDVLGEMGFLDDQDEGRHSQLGNTGA